MDSLQRGYELSHPLPGDEVVISGLSGKYPDSDNVYEFMDNLFNKYDMVNDDTRRWEHTNEDLPKRSGKLNSLSKFDAAFFDELYLQAECTDPLIRELLERIYEAILDAGINPMELRGTNTGVFIGSTYLETEKKWLIYTLQKYGYGLTGVARGWMASRLAYALGLNGPLNSIDSACSSSSSALTLAFESLRRGECESALVVGCNSLLNPIMSLQFARLGVLAPDGTCKVFDDRADGYARSEGVVAVLLQKAKNAKRVYCRLIHGKLNSDGYKLEGITFPSSQLQTELLQQLYIECEIDPESVHYVEAHGTGTTVGDPAEAQALVDVFCQNRTGLPVGSVKSNIGHSEGASGLCSVTKVIIAMETGIIPPNIHFEIPKKSIKGIMNGQLQVVKDKQPLQGGLVAINSFGFGGANVHQIFEWNSKIKKENFYNDNLPTLVCISGRTEEAILTIFKDLISRPIDREYINLYHGIHSKNIPGHQFRGYALLNKESSHITHFCSYLGQSKPLGIVFSSIDKKWSKINEELKQIPLYKKFYSKSTELIKILSKKLEIDFSGNYLYELFFSTILVQMAFIDVCKSLNIHFDYNFGTSIGQILAAYTNEIISDEQAIFITYQIVNLIKDKVKTDSNINDINSLIKTEDFENLWKLCLKKKSKFDETKIKMLDLKYLNDNVSDLTVILDLTSETNLSFFGEKIVFGNSETILKDFFEILGQLFEIGANPKIELLYPSVEYPVSRGTPMISPLIRWDHQDNWPVHIYNAEEKLAKGEYEYEIDISLKKHEFYTGHVIDQRNLFPATGYLYIVWECFLKGLKLDICNVPIIFEEVRFLRATHLSNSLIEFIITINMNTGVFSIVEKQTLITTGKISLGSQEFMKFPLEKNNSNDIAMDKEDIYKELRLRGYNYSGIFKGLNKYYPENGIGEIEWNNNWPAFMDNLMQIVILSEKTRTLYVPITIEQLIIDPRRHSQNEKEILQVSYDKDSGTIQSGGVELRGLHVMDIQRRKPLGLPVLEKYSFIPYENETKYYDWKLALSIIIHFILENEVGYNFNYVELIENEENIIFSDEIEKIIDKLPLYQSESVLLLETEKNFDLETKPNLIIGSNLLSHNRDHLNYFPQDCYIVSKEISTNLHIPSEYILQAKYPINDVEFFIVLKNSKVNFKLNYEFIITKSDSFEWIEEAKRKIEKGLEGRNGLLFVSQDEEFSGLLGYFNCLNREYPLLNMQCFIIEDNIMPKFDPYLEFYSKQIRKGLKVNVFKDGKWGSYRHLPFEKIDLKTVESAFVDITVRGDLSSLKWIQDNLDPKTWTPSDEYELVQTHYAALNFRDVMTASGKLSADVISKSLLSTCIQGLEYSGKTLSGRRVFGIVNSAGMATYVSADKALLWDVPEDWSLEDAATVPIIYGTCLYALIIEGRISRGDTVLIHAATGGIGQAAINLALYIGCRVFATCAPHKKNILLEIFPELNEQDIGNSRDCSFYDMIMYRTQGRGVDIVLNSLAEEKLRLGIKCLARGGRFLEIGKYDLSNNSRLDIPDFANGKSFHGVMLDKFFNADVQTKLKLKNLLLEFIQNKAIKPIVRTIFEMDEQIAAFKLMSSGKHIGKVLLKIRPEDSEVEPLFVKSIPRFKPNPNKSYIIIGGLGGFGLELGRWLVCRGVKEIVLNSRTGVKNGYQQSQIALWRKELNVRVIISTHVITKDSDVENLLKVSSLPIGGIFNLAVNLQDGIFENQTKESFEVSCGPKAIATKILDRKSRILCKELEYFVVFSSVSCGRGNTGQTNYGLSNSVMEKIVENRRKDGLPGLAIQWGAIGDVGLVAKLQENNEELVIGGTLIQSLKSCLECLDIFLNQSESVVASMVVAEKNSNLCGSANPMEFVTTLLGIQDINQISMIASFAEMGMDSMLGVEIKQGLEREFQIFISPKDLRNMTFTKLLEIYQNQQNAVEDKQENLSELINSIPTDDEIDHLMEPIVYFNKNKPGNPVFIVPGIESSYKILDNLIENIKAPVNFLQLSCYSTQTYQELANELSIHIINNVTDKSQIISLIGYSVGAAISIELVIILERKGFSCNLILIDGSPLVSKSIARSLKEVTMKYLNDADIRHNLNENSINEITFLIQVYHVTSGRFKIDKLYSNLIKCHDWKERLDVFFEHSEGWTFEFCKEYLNSVYSRFSGAYFYEKQTKAKLIESKCYFIRTQLPIVRDIGEDYDLGIYFKDPLIISKEETDHKSIASSQKTISIINKFLFD